MTDTVECVECGVTVKVTPTGKLRKHRQPSAQMIDGPECPETGAFPKGRCAFCGNIRVLTAERTFARHNNPIGDAICEGSRMTVEQQRTAVPPAEQPSGVRPTGDAQSATPPPSSPTETATTPGPTPQPPESSSPANTIYVSHRSPSEQPSVSPSSTAPVDIAPPSLDDAMNEAPKPRAKPRKRVPLEGEALALSDWFDDLFFEYQHARPRSLQATIGPSEIGSACMRKVAMKLSQRPEINLEKDSYAAWFGTQGHLGLEEMLRWKNEKLQVERFLVEAALEFGSEVMPHGHSDAFDRTPTAVGFDRLRGVVIDWKFPGESALGKMFLDGCPEDYQDQGHLYGYGQRLAGENVERVAVIALPRERGDLSKKFVWVAPYDEERAIAKIRKAEAIKRRLDEYRLGGNPEPWKKAPKTPSYLCPYCPFYLANDTKEAKGCSGAA